MSELIESLKQRIAGRKSWISHKRTILGDPSVVELHEHAKGFIADYERENEFDRELIAALSVAPATVADPHWKFAWNLTSLQLPPDGVEVIGFHEDWIDEDFNPNGTRVCFQNDGERWQSARWYDHQDTYINGDEQHFGDNPECSQAPHSWFEIPKPFTAANAPPVQEGPKGVVIDDETREALKEAVSELQETHDGLLMYGEDYKAAPRRIQLLGHIAAIERLLAGN